MYVSTAVQQKRQQFQRCSPYLVLFGVRFTEFVVMWHLAENPMNAAFTLDRFRPRMAILGLVGCISYVRMYVPTKAMEEGSWESGSEEFIG
jgi:hypothetical protein